MRLAFFSALGIVLGAGRASAANRGYLSVVAGIGYSDPSGNSIRGTGTGGFAEVDYSLPDLYWLKFYGGTLFTFPDSASCGEGVSPCDVSATLAFLGSKVRLTAPIPYVRPYIDLGVGLSAGSATVRVGDVVNRHRAGILFHVPVGLGVQIGNRWPIDVGMLIMFHPEVDGNFGALIGIGFGFLLE